MERGYLFVTVLVTLRAGKQIKKSGFPLIASFFALLLPLFQNVQILCLFHLALLYNSRKGAYQLVIWPFEDY